jgi:ABC-type branched-subunit amino acid transport system substrate-binding protein
LTAALAIGASIALLGSACSSGSNTTTGATGSNSAGPKGSPIEILTATPIATAEDDETEQEVAGKAAVAAINAAGGINGHPLNLTVCNSEFDPNVETNCARQAVSSHVAAAVGGVTLFPGFYSTIKSASIPFVGSYGLVPQDFTDSNVFPIDGGNYSYFYGAAALALQLGSKKPGIMACPATACVSSVGYFKDALKIAGITHVNDVSAPQTAPDYSTSAAQVTSGGTDSVTIVGSAVEMVKQITAIRQTGFKGPIIATDGDLNQSNISSLGAANTKNVYGISLLTPLSDTANPQVARFTAAVKAQHSNVKMTVIALEEWAAVNLFAEVAKRITGTIDAASVLKAMTNLATPVDLGVMEPYKVVGQTSPIPEAPRIFNFSVIFDKVANGALTAMGSPLNPIDLLKQGK